MSLKYNKKKIIKNNNFLVYFCKIIKLRKKKQFINFYLEREKKNIVWRKTDNNKSDICMIWNQRRFIFISKSFHM